MVSTCLRTDEYHESHPFTSEIECSSENPNALMSEATASSGLRIVHMQANVPALISSIILLSGAWLFRITCELDSIGNPSKELANAVTALPLRKRTSLATLKEKVDPLRGIPPIRTRNFRISAFGGASNRGAAMLFNPHPPWVRLHFRNLNARCL